MLRKLSGERPRTAVIVAAGIVAAAIVAAGAAVSVTAGAALAASLGVDAIAGVYKQRFPNGDVAGDRFTSENILEVVKVSPEAAYIRAHLEFYNGHLCSIWGIARLEGEALVYRPTLSVSSLGPCVLSLVVKGDRLVFDDKNGSCHLYYCGARGGFFNEGFPLKSRRAIRYLPRLLSSWQYAEAMRQYRTGKPQD